MTEEMEFLEQDAANPAEPPIENTPAPEESFTAPSWEDVKAGKINYQELPGSIKAKIKQEAYEAAPEDKKYLWDDYNYVPPELYKGFDKHGRKVQGYDLDGFEDLIRRGKVVKKTKIEEDVENLTNLVKEQNKTIITQQERDIDKRLSEAKENVDFEAYEKLLSEKQDLKFQKLQLDKRPEAQSEKRAANVASQYSLDEQVAIEVFGGNPENKTFIDLMQRNKEMEKEFDRAAYSLKSRNPDAPLDQIAMAAKTIVENKFNLNKQQRPMSRNIIQSEQRTNIASKPTQRLSYATLSDRDKKWVNSEARSGKPKYSGKSLDDVANIVYGHLLKK